MLLTETVSVQISSSNKKHFEALGYEFPLKWSPSNQRMVVPHGAKVDAKIEDATCGKIEYKCDRCGSIKPSTIERYRKKAIKTEDVCFTCYMGSEYHTGCKGRFGEDNPNWHADKTDAERSDDRSYPEYKEFVKECFERDNYTCQLTGKVGGQLAVHHLKSYAKYPKLRCDPSNGITLQRKIHNEFHKKYSKVKFTDLDFIEFREQYNGK
jgi:5-methylcytosine-specific restriction endonuclease McrA